MSPLGELHLNDHGQVQCVAVTPPLLHEHRLQDAANAIRQDSTVVRRIASPASATINVTYVDFPAVAEQSFQVAVDTWAGLLSSEIPIEVVAFYAPLPPGVLGAAGSTFLVSNFPGGQRDTHYVMALADKLAGQDLLPGEFDIFAIFNSQFPLWHFEAESNPAESEFDFRTVVLHELGHGLGFVGSATLDPEGLGSLGAGNAYPFVYDHQVVTRPGRQLTSENKFPNPSLELGDALIGSQLLFMGSRTTAVTRGDRAVLFSPRLWIPGSSYSHLDEWIYRSGSENALMTPFLSPGEFLDAPGPIVCAMMEDLGWEGGIRKPLNRGQSR
jgi:hypothetical protein